MTTDERKAMTELRNKLVEVIELMDGMLEASPKRKAPERKEIKPTPPGLLRIRRMFGHRDATLPSPKLVEDYLKLTKRYTKESFYEALDKLERFYSFRKRRQIGDPDLWSHDDHTLINNFDKKVATAEEFLKGKPTSVAKPPVEKIPEPPEWREWAHVNWPVKGWEYWKEVKWEELEGMSGVQMEIYKETRFKI